MEAILHFCNPCFLTKLASNLKKSINKFIKINAGFNKLTQSNVVFFAKRERHTLTFVSCRHKIYSNPPINKRVIPFPQEFKVFNEWINLNICELW